MHIGSVLCILTSQYKLMCVMWLGQYSLLHPVRDILGCSAIVFIVVKELPLPKRQQNSINIKYNILIQNNGKNRSRSSSKSFVHFYSPSFTDCTSRE